MPTRKEERVASIRSIRLKRDFQDYCAYRFLASLTPERLAQLAAEFGA